MPSLKNPMVPQELLVVGAALKAGIFDFLRDKPAKLDEIVDGLDLDLRATWTVVEALKSLGYVTKSNEVLRLTPDAIQLFFNEDSENYIGYSLIHTFNLIKSWTYLPEILKTGQSPKREHDLQDAKGFMAAMKKKTKEVSAQLVNVCLTGLPEDPGVLDIGGGPLNFARPFAAAGAIVTVQDLPDICALMEPTLLPGERIKFSPGDFTESVLPGQFDLAFLGNICHIYGEDENKLLFRRVHDSLRGGGRIAILDFVRGVSPTADLFAVNMLANTKAGGAWTLEQYTKWLETAGFAKVEMVSIGSRQVITAKRS